jgi:hypothetical protein
LAGSEGISNAAAMALSVALEQKERRARAGAERLALLRAHAVFGALDPAQLEELCSYALPRTVLAGTTIFSIATLG